MSLKNIPPYFEATGTRGRRLRLAGVSICNRTAAGQPDVESLCPLWAPFRPSDDDGSRNPPPTPQLLLLLLFIQVYCPCVTLGYERPTPHLLTDINIHSDTQAEPRKLSSLTIYIDLWQEGKPAPGQNPPVISPPVVIFRRIGVRTTDTPRRRRRSNHLYFCLSTKRLIAPPTPQEP
jgi:hypothetical protein